MQNEILITVTCIAVEFIFYNLNA
ncbi:hypothetical protein OOU_Y34scaffold00377g2 [Pyricularia oryzae Y34]|uniref:Uncharacterized protein n=1 Tax=Pyricularia oryzae (strain Y34) TaxID=1143189 RepID=A0AA97P238_PYRO3|nr:hypothetical protein OOU_Y34scaffold00377g2 [Pyricularia oryzae Y34]